MTVRSLDGVQRAAAFVAARSRRDGDSAATLLQDFTSDDERLISFVMLAELAIRLIAEQDGTTPDIVAKDLALYVARTGAKQGPWN